MALRLQIQGVRQLDDGVWKAHLLPSELRFLSPKGDSVGPVSVLLLTEEPQFDRDSGCLSFNPLAAKLLNIGTTDTLILIGSTAAPVHHLALPTRMPEHTRAGDTRFLESLPSHLKELGTHLLQAVRRQFPGELTFYTASGKFVETPDNFWTVRPQPRDRSLRITIRGLPESFDDTGSLVLKPDMSSYSSFKVSQLSQIEDFIRVLKKVRRK